MAVFFVFRHCFLAVVWNGFICGLDGDQALQQAGDWLLEPGQACFDMLTDIQNKILKLRITVKWWWI
jgi:hypothetical protein